MQIQIESTDQLKTIEDVFPPPCIHADGKTFCPECRWAWEYDPDSYLEYGDHPAGLKNWRALQKEIKGARNAKIASDIDSSLPF